MSFDADDFSAPELREIYLSALPSGPEVLERLSLATIEILDQIGATTSLANVVEEYEAAKLAASDAEKERDEAASERDVAVEERDAAEEKLLDAERERDVLREECMKLRARVAELERPTPAKRGGREPLKKG